MRNNKFHCHDEDEYCRTGDKVVIRFCKKISDLKYYYVRNVVLPIGRHQTYEQNTLSNYEKDQINYNEELRNSYTKIYFWMFASETEGGS